MTTAFSKLDTLPRDGLAVSGLCKQFGSNSVIRNVDLSVGAGEVVALVGPSGAGKTTLCRMIAGLEQPDTGACHLGGVNLASMPPGQRRVAMMFESYALYPHLSVRENILSPLQARAKGRLGDDVRQNVDQLLTLLEIAHLGDRQPVALSGGQKQRVALARALVQDPSALLLDEPISHLDAKLRHKLRGEIRRRLSARGHPSIWSTPDGLEGLSVGDRVAVLVEGGIEQIGTPEDIWLRPASIRVAKLFGDPPMNVLQGEIRIDGGRTRFHRSDLAIELPDAQAWAAARLSSRAVFLGLRPGGLSLSAADAPGAIAGQVYSNEAFGKHALVTVRTGAGDLVKIKTKEATALGLGEPIGFQHGTDEFFLFDGGTGNAVL
jgi:multiple sugar transport system ATP-binding protein